MDRRCRASRRNGRETSTSVPWEKATTSVSNWGCPVRTSRNTRFTGLSLWGGRRGEWEDLDRYIDTSHCTYSTNSIIPQGTFQQAKQQQRRAGVFTSSRKSSVHLRRSRGAGSEAYQDRTAGKQTGFLYFILPVMLNANRKTQPGSRPARRKASAAARPHLHTNPLGQGAKTFGPSGVTASGTPAIPGEHRPGLLRSTTVTGRNQRINK